jgi:hypothetical protein
VIELKLESKSLLLKINTSRGLKIILITKRFLIMINISIRLKLKRFKRFIPLDLLINDWHC